MRRVSVTIGPVGAGKSTFCTQYIRKHPDTIMVSRDAILIKMFGTTWLSSYSDGHLRAHAKMWKQVTASLRRPDVQLILDCWNGSPEEREDITRKLRGLGVEYIVGWYFVTPEHTSVEWRHQKENGTTGLSRRAYRDDYRLFHSMPVSTDQGFNEIRKIDPTEQTFFDKLFA